MADRLEKLRNTLAELERELASVDSLDDEARERLADAAAEIAATLRRGRRTEETSQAEESLKDRLVDFEAQHPQIAILVGRVLDGLANLGI
jgi:hypothetical protein